MRLKPVIVCGTDFSGTSLVAGLLHEAGIDMGDIETEEEVRDGQTLLPYMTYECQIYRESVAVLPARVLSGELPEGEWVNELVDTFQAYTEFRNTSKARWGFKNNGLVHLALDNRINYEDYDWVLVTRPFDESYRSCKKYLGNDPRYFTVLIKHHGAVFQWVKSPRPKIVIEYNRLLANPETETNRLLVSLGITPSDEHKLVDPVQKGVLTWHGLQLGQR